VRLVPDDSRDTLGSDDEQKPTMTPKSSPEYGDQANVNPDEFITEFRGLHLLVDEAISSLLRLSVQIHKSSTKAGLRGRPSTKATQPARISAMYGTCSPILKRPETLFSQRS
jgi:hypothetical protein